MCAIIPVEGELKYLPRPKNLDAIYALLTGKEGEARWGKGGDGSQWYWTGEGEENPRATLGWRGTYPASERGLKLWDNDGEKTQYLLGPVFYLSATEARVLRGGRVNEVPLDEAGSEVKGVWGPLRLLGGRFDREESRWYIPPGNLEEARKTLLEFDRRRARRFTLGR